MKRVDEFITEKDVKDFCMNCNKFCTRHCVIWHKAELEYNEYERNERKRIKDNED